MIMINQNTKTKKAFSISVVLVLVILISIFAFNWWTTNKSSKTPPAAINSETVDNYVSSEPTTSDQKTGSDSVKDDITSGQPANDNYSGSITSATQSDDVLYIRTNIQAVTSTGTCNLKMAGPSDKTYSASSSVQALAASSTCQGFNVPVNSLAKGPWNISITYSDGPNSVTMKKEVNIQ